MKKAMFITFTLVILTSCVRSDRKSHEFWDYAAEQKNEESDMGKHSEYSEWDMPCKDTVICTKYGVNILFHLGTDTIEYWPIYSAPIRYNWEAIDDSIRLSFVESFPVSPLWLGYKIRQ